jgi:hypothetical protein
VTAPFVLALVSENAKKQAARRATAVRVKSEIFFIVKTLLKIE